ncbi:MAG: ABC transporter substrate-binding protein [Firmicutes bacterium]|nr:ABC transporter substrate-binding protein [Bacillota bacterium]
MKSGSRRKIGVSIMSAATLAFGLAGCGATSSTNAIHQPAAKVGHHASIASYIEAPDSPFVANFNPFSPSNSVTSAGLAEIYEPLLHFNTYTGQIVPKLATSYTYSDNHQTITFHLRHGVKWSNGLPFTSADAVFTYDMILGATLRLLSSSFPVFGQP